MECFVLPLPCLPSEDSAKVGVLSKESKERESRFVRWGLPHHSSYIY